MNICVYLSAQDGKSEAYKETVRHFGKFIAENGHRLIYGGSKSGLMGEIAISALEAGGEVIGVEPEFFIEAEFQLEGLTELIVTRSMNERKEKLIELSDVFVAFPGSTGTLEEIADTVSMIKMGMIAKKITATKPTEMRNVETGACAPIWPCFLKKPDAKVFAPLNQVLMPFPFIDLPYGFLHIS